MQVFWCIIEGYRRPKPHGGDVSLEIPWSSVNWGPQGLLEEQQINVLLFILNLLVHMLCFKIFGAAQISKGRSAATRDANPIKATGRADEIKTLGFDFVGISRCRGRETTHLKIAFWVGLSEQVSVDLYKLIPSQSMDRSLRAASGGGKET